MSVALVTSNKTGEWIRLDTDMPKGSPSIKVVNGITDILVRKMEAGQYYFYKILNVKEMNRGHLEDPKETYDFEN